MRQVLYTLICLPFILLGCLSKAPSKSEISGTWISASDAVIEFREDGTFTGKLLPANYFTVWDWNEKEKIVEQKVNGSGKWKLVKAQEWEIQLTFHERSDKKMFGELNLMVSKDGNKWIVWRWEGDEADNVEFFKK
jgi:hypothetical protein